ncbi:hypothetical protein [Acidovorax sp. sic0104]|uniref:hypothetical protein n=1 Tax=Acidovorax sp. sic0104 TaxID=2854784 RepID=UPI001C44320A|nr:hypothetical protein [Acidovorax sp. sic0104]MBV7542014.1 hypothetical protein [Acidovorax sp. sic0104]
MTNASTMDHKDLALRRQLLLCTCCGSRATGRQFHNQDTGHGLGDCCVDFVRPRTEDMERTYGVAGVHYLLDPLVKVRTPDAPAQWGHWSISQNLTDRWGEINEAEPDLKLVQPLLISNPGLLDRLRSQMHEEDTFVVHKGGRWGILFELEHYCRESDANAQGVNSHEYPPQAVVEKGLLDGMRAIASQFPGVDFAVPGPGNTYNDRPAAWAFVPDGLLNPDQREQLGTALGSLLRIGAELAKTDPQATSGAA